MSKTWGARDDRYKFWVILYIVAKIIRDNILIGQHLHCQQLLSLKYAGARNPKLQRYYLSYWIAGNICKKSQILQLPVWWWSEAYCMFYAAACFICSYCGIQTQGKHKNRNYIKQIHSVSSAIISAVQHKNDKTLTSVVGEMQCQPDIRYHPDNRSNSKSPTLLSIWQIICHNNTVFLRYR